MANPQFRDFVATTGHGHLRQDAEIVAIGTLAGLHHRPGERALAPSAQLAAVFYLGAGAWCMVALFAAAFSALL
jgi:hypothetical protein